jgi:cytoplasmic iron level regulating protein YaaA (DUF328/UPF0246 family)
VLSILSPAKTLDYETPPTIRKSTQPLFIDQATALVKRARKMNPDDIQALMGVSEKIATLNYERFMNWEPDFSLKNAKQSVLAFKGDVYTGLDADTLTADELAFAQKHLRILSGLYGLLRPLDLMQPYRLEMGLPFENTGGKNLYEFWGDRITEVLGKHLKASGSNVLVNLASNEYFKAVKPKLLEVDVITPQFRDLKNGQYKMISFFAKKARGVMARYIIQKGLNEPEGLKRFKGDGYYYSAKHSDATNWVFLRDAPPQAG